MDETAIAFELPHARASATQSGPPPDRISVRDYTRQVEIGAFRSERGVTQRVRFNVVLEVSHHTAAQDDDVDKVISYDTITEAIEHELAAERINLLETLAERVAARCLADRRAVRVFVRIEKLDRIPGALGVEIVRSRLPDAASRLRPVDQPPLPAAGTRARVVYLAPDLADDAAWRDALAAWSHPLVVCLAPAEPRPAAATEGQRRIGLLAIEQAAWAFCDRDPRFTVAASRTEIDWALKSGRRLVWAPSHMVTAALDRAVPDASDPAALAAWLAAEIGAETLVVAGAAAPQAPVPLAVVAAADPQELTDLA
jgi:7,8-dihydroneopterin aldolase/epimerase/oxygenase